MNHFQNRPQRKNARWQPFRWMPKYEEMVFLHCRGWKNTEIAAKFEMRDVQISKILNCDEAIKIKQQFIAKVREEGTQTLPEKIAAIELRAFERIEKVMNDEEFFEAKKLQMFDRSLNILKALSKNVNQNSGTTINNNHQSAVITEGAAKILMNGLDKSNEAFQLHAPSLKLEKSEKGKLTA